MSVIGAWMQSVVLLFSFLTWPVHAEMGVGTVEDPVTREYTDGVYKDWQEGIVFHQETGNYLITYKDSYDSFNQIVFEPSTKIDPTLKSKFTNAKKKRIIVYEYKLRNNRKSRQDIRMFNAHVTNVNPGSPLNPKDGDGTVVRQLSR